MIDNRFLDPMMDLDVGPAARHSAGGKIKLPLHEGVTGQALFYGPNDCYRPWLSRTWASDDERYILFIGMNPSTAEATIDDPTIRRELEFARRFGFSRYIKCNVMDWRATSPKDLLKVEPCSDMNRPTILKLAAQASQIIACWGKLPRQLQIYSDRVLFDLASHDIFCLGRNEDGSPKHPLYIKGDAELELYRAAR